METEAEKAARLARLAAARERLRTGLVGLRIAEEVLYAGPTAQVTQLPSRRIFYDESISVPWSTRDRTRAYPRLVISNSIPESRARDVRQRPCFSSAPPVGVREPVCEGALEMKNRVTKLMRGQQITKARARLRDQQASAERSVMKRAEMPNDEPIDHHELRGRLAAIETLLLTLTAYTASHVERNGGDLVTFSAAIFRDVENELQDAAAAAAGTESEPAAKLALETHRNLSRQLVPQLNRHRLVDG
jgi:hypothetical protein